MNILFFHNAIPSLQIILSIVCRIRLTLWWTAWRTSQMYLNCFKNTGWFCVKHHVPYLANIAMVSKRWFILRGNMTPFCQKPLERLNCSTFLLINISESTGICYVENDKISDRWNANNSLVNELLLFRLNVPSIVPIQHFIKPVN